MAREQDIQDMARKLLPESYTENWQEKQQIWIAGAQWADENSVIEDLRMDIRDLKDEISDLEWKHEEEIESKNEEIKALQEENKSLIQQVEELEKEVVMRGGNK